MEPQSLSVYILSGLVLETYTSELAVHVRWKIALIELTVLDFVHQDLYMWSLDIFLYM